MQLISRFWTVPIIILFLLATATSALAQGGGSGNDVVVQTSQGSGNRKLKFADLANTSKTSGILYKWSNDEWQQIGTWTRPAGQQDVTEFDTTGNPQLKYGELGNSENTNGPITDLDPNGGPSGGTWQRSS